MFENILSNELKFSKTLIYGQYFVKTTDLFLLKQEKRCPKVNTLTLLKTAVFTLNCVTLSSQLAPAQRKHRCSVSDASSSPNMFLSKHKCRIQGYSLTPPSIWMLGCDVSLFIL